MTKEPSLSSSMPWIKLWTDFTDDPKIGACSEGAQLLFVKLLALAGQCDAEGYLVNGDDPLTRRDIAWRLRIDLDRVDELIEELIEVELLFDDEGYLLIQNFSKRQGRSQMQKREKWVERQRRSRAKRATNGVITVTGDNNHVTRDNIDCHAGVTLPEGEGEKRERREEGEEESAAAALPADWLPENPKQAMRHPDIRIYREVCERIPGIDQYRTTIQTIQLLRQKVPEETALVAYLSRFWLAWSSRTTRGGKPYDLSSLAWLTEWAVNDHIPPATPNGNGRGKLAPPGEYTAQQKKSKAREEYLRQVAALEAQDAGTNDNNDHLAGRAEGTGQAAAKPGVGGRSRAGPLA